MFLGNHIKKFVCRGSLNSYTSKNMLMTRTPKCEQQEVTSTRISKESHLHWKKHFHKNTLYVEIIADFGTENEIDNSSIGDKTTNNYKQNPVRDVYYIVSEWEDVLKSVYYISPLKVLYCLNVCRWNFQIRNQLAFCFKNPKKICN